MTSLPSGCSRVTSSPTSGRRVAGRPCSSIGRCGRLTGVKRFVSISRSTFFALW